MTSNNKKINLNRDAFLIEHTSGKKQQPIQFIIEKLHYCFTILKTVYFQLQNLDGIKPGNVGRPQINTAE